jgi:uncharacterized C2H2 Zn-finger protein|tara:strand:+ start:348 stop:515 length:168 start_codon:yes stop_codon:yes gene_type:complete
MIGIPYARQTYKNGKMTCTCPVCGKVIELKKKKDHESYSTQEYALHYDQAHGVKT